MITFVRTVYFKNALALSAAMPVCEQLVKFLREKGVDSSMMVAVLGGNPARALFVTKGNDIAGVQSKMAECAADSKYIDIVRKVSEFTDGAQTSDQLWRTAI